MTALPQENQGIKKNLAYAFSAQGVALLSSILMSLIVPKILAVEEYAYWQSFLLYAGYSGCLLVGINDGLYLRIGGQRYGDLDHAGIKAQMVLVLILEFFFSALLIAFALLARLSAQFCLIAAALSIYTIVVNLANYLSYVFQAVNLTQIFSKAAIITKASFFIMIVAALVLGAGDYRVIVAFYIVSQCFSMVYLLYSGRQILQARFSFSGKNRDVLHATKIDIGAGMKIMISYYAGTFIIGFGRMLIEPNWDLATFGYYSFAVSLVSFVISFAGQVSMVLFPHIKRASKEAQKENFVKIRSILALFLPIAYVLYFPCCIFCEFWLPQYSQSLIYLGLLFPICIFDCRMSMLCVPYFKALRKENKLLIANVVAMCVSVVLSFFSVFLFHNLVLLAVSMLSGIVTRNLISEFNLARSFGLNLFPHSIRELLLAICFIFVVMIDGGWSYVFGSIALVVYYFFECFSLKKTREKGGM